MLDDVLRRTPLRAGRHHRARGGVPAGRRRREGGRRSPRRPRRSPTSRRAPTTCWRARSWPRGSRPTASAELARYRAAAPNDALAARLGDRARAAKSVPLVPPARRPSAGAARDSRRPRQLRHPAQRRLRLHASAGRSTGGSTTSSSSPETGLLVDFATGRVLATTATPSAAPPCCWRSARRPGGARRARPARGRATSSRPPSSRRCPRSSPAARANSSANAPRAPPTRARSRRSARRRRLLPGPERHRRQLPQAQGRLRRLREELRHGEAAQVAGALAAVLVRYFAREKSPVSLALAIALALALKPTIAADAPGGTSILSTFSANSVKL